MRSLRVGLTAALFLALAVGERPAARTRDDPPVEP